MADQFPCGHERVGYNRLSFSNGKSGRSERCRKCHNAYQTARQNAGRGAVRFVIAMLTEGTLSEGQVAAITGLDRITIRQLADDHRANSCVAEAA